jgi:hypothetical protein
MFNAPRPATLKPEGRGNGQTEFAEATGTRRAAQDSDVPFAQETLATISFLFGPDLCFGLDGETDGFTPLDLT